MKNHVIFVLFGLLLGLVPVVSGQVANAGSPGCQQWTGGVGGGLIGNISGSAQIPISIPSADYKAGEELHFSWSVSENHTMTVASPIINETVNQVASTPDIYSITVPANGNYKFMFTLTFDYTNGYFYQYSLACIVPAQTAESEPVICQFDDGRVNDRDCDTSTVIYQSENSIDIYAIDPNTSDGTLVLRVPIPNINEFTGTVLLHEIRHPNTGDPIHLWLLDSGELQLSTTLFDGKPYTIVWLIDAPDSYTRRE